MEVSRLSVASLIPYEQFIVVRNRIPLAVGSIAGKSENVCPSQSHEDLQQAPSVKTTRLCQRPQFSIPSAVCGAEFVERSKQQTSLRLCYQTCYHFLEKAA